MPTVPPDKLPYPAKKAVRAPLGESDFFRRPWKLRRSAMMIGVGCILSHVERWAGVSCD